MNIHRSRWTLTRRSMCAVWPVRAATPSRGDREVFRNRRDIFPRPGGCHRLSAHITSPFVVARLMRAGSAWTESDNWHTRVIMDMEQVLERAQGMLNGHKVFGEPIEIGGNTLLPVSTVRGGGG